MKTRQFVESKELNENGEEIKTIDYSSRVVYPSKSKTYSFIFLNWGIDLTPQSEINKYIKKGEASEDDKTDIYVTMSLPKPVKGRYKAMSNKQVVWYKAKVDLKAEDGSIRLKAGDIGGCFDKIKECVLVDAMTSWKNVGEKRYRRSTETFLPVYLLTSEKVNTDTNKMEIEEINKPVLMAFNVADVAKISKQGFGNKLIKLATAIDKEKKDGSLAISNKVYEYNADDLTPSRNIDSDELKTIKPLRQKTLEDWKEEFKDLYPLPYDEFVALVESGEAKIELPETAKKTVVSSDKVKQMIQNNDGSQENVNDEGEVEDDDLPPF